MSEQERRQDEALRDFLDELEEGKHPFGIVTQAGYKELQTLIRTWIKRGLIAFSIIGAACVVSLAGFGVLLTQQNNTTDDIQEQRYNALLDACENTNARHDDVVAKIDKAVEETPKSKQDPQGVAAFKLILEAAVPHTEDCQKYARNRVGGFSE